MTTSDDEFSRELTRLTTAFAAQLQQQVQSLEDDLAAWLSAPRETALFDTLGHKVHQLKGAGGTFGCSTVSEAAQVLEQRLAALEADATGAAGSDLDEVEAAMQVLRREANRMYRSAAQRGQAGTQL